MAVVVQRIRDTAQRDAQGNWPFDDIFNRELYPAILALNRAVSTGTGAAGVWEPVFLTGATNVFTDEHGSKHLLVDHTDVTTLSMDATVSAALPLGTLIFVSQQGTGQLELVAGSGVTFTTTETTKLKKQWSTGMMLKISDTEWWLFGDFEDLPSTTVGFIVDRFLGGAQSVAGTSTNANVGELQWNTVLSTAAGSVDRVASIASHMGIVRISSAAGSGRQAIYLGHSAVAGNLVNLDEMDSTSWTVAHVAHRIRFGFGSDPAAAGLGAEAFYIEASPDAPDPNFWVCVVRSASVNTSFTTSIPIVTSEFVEWKIQRVSGTEFRFFADGELVHTATSGTPDPGTVMGPAFQSIQNVATAIGEIDTFVLQLKPV